ncbi:MAG: CocE/NonD family hydrolase [Planctomycetota bacterium]|jgi:putative CocE/NonD family hydrolase
MRSPVTQLLRTLVVVGAFALMMAAAPAGTEVTVQPDLMVPMSDGVNLATDVYLPDETGTFPVVFSRSPYNKRQFQRYLAEPLARAGYAVVMQDVRGMNGSEGMFVPFIHEKQDGLDTLNWIAGQPWCDGNIGMWGPSYVGFCALILTTESHPKLKAVVNVSGWGNTQELVAPGGAMHLQQGLPWTLSGQIRGQGSLRDIDWNTAFKHVPVTEIPTSIGISSEAWEGAVQLFSGDILARTSDMAGRFDTVSAPTLHLTGWYDFVARHTLDVYEGVDAATDTPQKLVVGPWQHDQQWGDETLVGDEDFGEKSIMGMHKVIEHSQRWFDRWLKDDHNGIASGKPVRLFVMGVNDWREFDQWPPRAVELQNWYFTSQDGANGLEGDGRLAPEAPITSGRDTFVFDPMDPVPTTGGANCHFFRRTLGVRDQRPVQQRPDVLVYTSEPLERDLTIIGPLQAVIHAATEGKHTDFTAKLCEVRPDGYAAVIEDGIRRGPDSLVGQPGALMEPGKVYRFTIDMGGTGIRIAKGNRLRMEISSSNFPKYSRNPNTGEEPESASRFETVTQTIVHAPDEPSYIVLPILRND